MVEERRAGMGLATPINYFSDNIRSGNAQPFSEMHVGIGSQRLPKTQWFDDFEQWRGPLTTGTAGGYEVINVNSALTMDTSEK